MNTTRKQAKGFTLIELMITVAIVAILAAIAYPSYRAQIRKSNRTAAKSTLLAYAQSLEKCFTQNGNYTGCGVIATVTSSSAFDSGKNLYAISIAPAAPTTTYTITAQAQGAQSDDAHCATLTLQETGLRGGTNTDCW